MLPPILHLGLILNFLINKPPTFFRGDALLTFLNNSTHAIFHKISDLIDADLFADCYLYFAFAIKAERPTRLLYYWYCGQFG